MNTLANSPDLMFASTYQYLLLQRIAWEQNGALRNLTLEMAVFVITHDRRQIAATFKNWAVNNQAQRRKLERMSEQYNDE